MANKPWLKKTNEREIEVMGAKISLKPLAFGDSRKAISQAMKIDMATQKTEVDASLVGILRALAQIKDWDLTDEDDNKLPITLDTLDNLLDEEFVGELIQKISEVSDSSPSDKEKKQ